MNIARFAGIALLVFTFSGCGDPTMGRVSGTVTLDGKPLPNAVIYFQPVNGERPSGAPTDEKGRYDLMYATTTAGARVGEHKVTITTYSEMTIDNETGNHSEGTPELVPDKYNIKSELTATVKPGQNTIDFSLEPGPISKRNRTPGY
ncbi:MAG: carboxypeptidase regulatory-like domain-containing protein [Planctomycetales bacterium]|nr:carboxypeptidase regulatory-like domain-containing protein [Planctomycetales bacterium]